MTPQSKLRLTLLASVLFALAASATGCGPKNADDTSGTTAPTAPTVAASPAPGATVPVATPPPGAGASRPDMTGPGPGGAAGGPPATYQGAPKGK